MRTNRDKRLLTALRLAMGSGLAAAMITMPAVSSAQEEDAAELERVQVTGSRLSRADLEGALPVTVIDREQIEFSGVNSVADLLRTTTFNSAGSFRPQSGSSAQSFAGVSLRGLGENRTLVLIDGRRAPVAPMLGQAQDLNAVPLAAVERIEILSDGASAVYGSDAIGGVINIITRKDFTGAEVSVGASNPSREGGDTAEFSAILGVAGDRGQMMFGVSRNYRDIIFQRDREWSAGGGSSFSNNFATSASGAFMTHPVFGSVVPGDGCTGEGFSSVVTPQAPAPAPTLTDEQRQRCLYDFTLLAADEAEIENTSLFARGRYDINSNWSHYFNASVTRVESFGRYAPVPSSPWPGGLPSLQPGSPNHPATPADEGGLNPEWEQYQDFAADTLYFYHRFASLGPRDANTDNNVYDVNLGFEASLGRFELDFGFRNTESKFYDHGLNYVVAGLAQTAIDDGDYNIYDPFSVTADVANSMIATIARNSTYQQQEVYAIASTDLFDLPSGAVQLAFGAEYRDEEYADNYDSLSEGGQIVGSAGNSAGGGRSVSAAFFETLVPLTDTLEMNLAGRYDRYSDYGSDFSPKLSFRWQPVQEMTLRASYGQGFRAPTLDILTQQPAFSASSVVHEPTAIALGAPTPTTAVQITSYSLANPALGSENSDQFALGFAFEPTTWFSGSIDYYNITIEDRIVTLSAQGVLNCIEGTSDFCPTGLSELDADMAIPNVAAGLGVAYNDDGSIAFIQYGSTNLGEIETDGLDINLRSLFSVGPGELSNSLQITYVNSYKVNGEDVIGEANWPEYRARLENVYAFGDFSFAYNLNFIAAQDTSFGNVDANGGDPGVDSWLTHDLQANWYTPWNGRLTVGVNNVTDEDPPLDAGESRGFNFYLYDAYGRLPYVRYTQTF